MPSYSFSLSGSYNSTAGGYQIGGNDNAKATISTLTLPNTYAKYGDTYIYLTFYSATAPSSWPDNYSFTIKLTINGSSQSNLFGRNDAVNYFDSLGSNKYRMGINLGTTFNSGTTISGSINSYTGAFVNGSSKCLYLCAAEFVSDDAYNTFKLSYNANGGTGAPSTQTKDTTATSYTFTISSTKPTRTNYDFKGWATSSNGSASYQPGGKYTVYSSSPSATLYAVWAVKTYTVSFYNGSTLFTTQIKTHGTNLTITSSTPNKTGYIFNGWNTASDGSGTTYASGASYTINANLTLYAQWLPKEYSVLYYGNAEKAIHSETGEKIWEDTVNKFKFGEEYNIDINTIGNKGFKYPGYNLLGWNTSWTAIEPLEKIKIEEDKQPELYAIWELGSNIRVYTNENWQIAIPYIYENGEWKLSISKVFNNEEWRQ